MSVAATAAQVAQMDERVPTYDKILGTVRAIPGAAAAQAYVSSAVSAATDPSTSSYVLSVLMYTILYVFILFLILLCVHYTFMPVFQFTPGSSGLLAVPTVADDKIYWNTKSQPPPESRVPLDSDAIAQAPFDKDFTVSVDLYLRRPIDSNTGKRILFYKTYRYGPETGTAATGAAGGGAAITAPSHVAGVADPASLTLLEPTAATASTPQQPLTESMATMCSMMAYLGGSSGGENDLYVVLYSGSSQYSSIAIKNVPTYTPFRLSVIVESTLFTVYINERQVFQRTVPSGISLNSNVSPPSTLAKPQRFYSPPAWTDDPTKTIFLQNFHLWPRAISYSELKAAQPSLAAEADFNLPVEAGSSSCS